MDDLQMSTTLVPQLQGCLLESDLTDFISRMPDDVLVMILGLLPITEAVVTSCLSKRWRFLWRDVTRLNFVRPKNLYINQYINGVDIIIKSYHPPIVQDFRIGFSLKYCPVLVIHEWLQFAVNKKVEFIELDLMDHYENDQYDFPSRLFDTKFGLLSSNAIFVEILSLKKLILKKVNVRESILKELLTNCPYLETITIHYSRDLNSICIGGRSLKLKHFEIVGNRISSIYLSDFGLESFVYKGVSIDLRLTNLPKLKKVDLCNPISLMRMRGLPGTQYNVFNQIASCALSLQALSLDLMYYREDCLKLDSLPKLTNLKKLSMVIGVSKCYFLLDLASILNACPNLETFTLQPFWTSPITNKRKARGAIIPHPCLKAVEIMGYYGRTCDFELVAYIIHSSVALKKIVIDTSSRPYGNNPNFADFKYVKNKEGARSSANCQLLPIVPRSVELRVL